MMSVSSFETERLPHKTVYSFKSHTCDSLRTKITPKMTNLDPDSQSENHIQPVGLSNIFPVSFYSAFTKESHLANVHLMCVFACCGSIGGEDGGAVAVGVTVD